MFFTPLHLIITGILLGATCALSAAPADWKAELKDLAIRGGLDDNGKARLVIEASLGRFPDEKEKLIYATRIEHSIKASAEKLDHAISARLDILQGEPKEVSLAISGSGEIQRVTGDALRDWSIRQAPNGARSLVLRFSPGEQGQLAVSVAAVQELKISPGVVVPFTLTPALPALSHGYVKLEAAQEWDVQIRNSSGLVPIEPQFLPDSLRADAKADGPETLAFRFHGTAYSLPVELALADPAMRAVVLRDFRLTGQVNEGTAAFTLTATAGVKSRRGGSLALLSGAVALTELEAHPDWQVNLDCGQFVLKFERPGDFPIRLQFDAAVRQSNGWNSIHFRVAPSALQPILLRGLPAETQFQFIGAARPERTGNDFGSYLPPDGAVNLSWKEMRPETEGKLFYAAEMLSQISISPGLMTQEALLEFKVMQGELSRVVLLLHGEGEVTRVQGGSVLAWNVEPVPDSSDRRVVVQLNQPQKDAFALQLQVQTPLGGFPQSIDVVHVRPEGATRFAGYCRVVNAGAVRLEITQARGLSQVAPEQFPENDATQALFRVVGSQRFAYRFSGADGALRIQADQVVPELTVSEVLAYHLGENELAVDAEIELDIREAPVRELLLQVPKGYSIARLTVPGLSDYFLREPQGEPDAELRLVLSQPVTGRQLIQARLERNQALGSPSWVLPRLAVARAKSVRGHVGISADAGFRLTAERTEALTEIATAFFPRKLAGIQAAFRLSEPAWAAAFRVERLAQSVQADVFHLFSVGEGIAYGSSVINYVVSGAPVAGFRIELSDEFFNVEFTGKDIRNWQKATNGYVVQLHTPVSGAYTLLATYERPFKAQGETLAFTGARPMEVQSEQGHTIVISAYQFQVQPVQVSPGLLPLDTGEVPPEYRLFFDAPILAAYRYTSRPFNLRLALSPLAQGDSLNQVVDRASLHTRISKAGQVLTDARYFVKTRGQSHFRLALPEGTQLWSASVNGAPVVPVTDATGNLIPLPQRADPNAVLTLDLKLASRSDKAKRVKLTAPPVGAPIMLAEWKLTPDTGQRLVYKGGSLTPVRGVADTSGFAGWGRVFAGNDAVRAGTLLLAALALVGIAVAVWRWTAREGVFRFSARHVAGFSLGLVAFVMALAAFSNLGELAQRQQIHVPGELTFVAPVQQANSAWFVQVANVENKASVWAWIGYGWPALLALAIWAYGGVTRGEWFNAGGWVLGWMLVAWAALRWPNGATAFLLVVVSFLLLHVAIPALRRLIQAPGKPRSPSESGAGAPAPVMTMIFMSALLWLGHSNGALAASGAPERMLASSEDPFLPESVTQQIRVEDTFVLASATVRWRAVKGQMLPLLREPAVLTQVTLPNQGLKLVSLPAGDRQAHQLVALESGLFEVECHYQVPVRKQQSESGFVLPTPRGLVNQVQLTLVNLDVDVVSTQAVTAVRETVGSNTVARLVLPPENDTWIGWRPRTRDLKSEKAVFYAELFQVYVPSAGAIEGVHYIMVRPAQGQLTELVLDVPAGATITDVVDATTKPGSATDTNTPTTPAAPLVATWRFDPDKRKLRVNLSAPEFRPLTLLVRSQIATGSLPFEHSIGVISVESAAGQIGLLGFASGNEVQLDAVQADDFSPVNIEDFPATALQPLQAQIPGLTLRRAYRYADANGRASMKASGVEADVRVETQETLSLGEDRTVLAANATINITRAGLFRLSFALPPGLEVESISGPALSHWTELKTEAGRIITLHLRGKTEGQQQFAISLSGPGIKTARAWTAPQFVLREASKQRGTLLVVPEQGMHLQVGARMGVTQLDPQKSGVQQKGVLAFRLLQTPWNLALDIEQRDPWIQVTSLQHATINEALVKVAANLQYHVENTGLKSFRVALPASAETVRFQGEQVSDFRPAGSVSTNGMQSWEIKLHRRVIGAYLLQVTYQTPVPEQATETALRGVQVEEVNLQRGFVTLQSGGRLQVRVDALPTALQPAEWQSIPRALQQDLQTASANVAYRLVEPSFALPLHLDRREVAKLLPARVNRTTLTSVISDDGVMLTQVRLEMLPGDKRLLSLTLPQNARFWFAFVNQNGVWPWREQDRILIPLEQQSRSGAIVPVEVFYSSQIGTPARRALDLELQAPKFDLPLENITWSVYLNDKWQVTDWAGSLQLEEQQIASRAAAVDVQTYLQGEASAQREKTKEAEQMLAAGNIALQQGDPQQARRAFQAAYGLSQGDDAFNEDARVQLNNLKLQQAVVGLNVRQAAVAGDPDALASKLRELRRRKDANYTQQDAKAIIDRNTADENAALLRLANRLIQQQDAAMSSPAAIRASIPAQGRVLTFKRTVLVDNWADLRITLAAKAATAATWMVRTAMLAGTLLLFGALALAARRFHPGTNGRDMAL